jgi:hypothetical protein
MSPHKKGRSSTIAGVGLAIVITSTMPSTMAPAPTAKLICSQNRIRAERRAGELLIANQSPAWHKLAANPELIVGGLRVDVVDYNDR